MKRQTTLVLSALLLLAAPGAAAAQDGEPDAAVNTYCLTVDVPAEIEVDVSNVLDDISILTVVTLDNCGAGAEDDASTLRPPGSEVTLDRWTFSIESINDSAWKRIQKENRLNDPPPRGTRLVMLTMRVGHDERGTAYDPRLDIEYSLFGPDDAMDEYSGIWPGPELWELGGIPGGRSKTFRDVFVVPNTVKLKDLVLYYVEDDALFAEIALAE